MACNCSFILSMLLAICCPPISVALQTGKCGKQMCKVICYTFFLGYIPGSCYAVKLLRKDNTTQTNDNNIIEIEMTQITYNNDTTNADDNDNKDDSKDPNFWLKCVF